MIEFPLNVALFLFSTMMAAVVVQLWSIAKILKSICDVLENRLKRDETP
jgi:hypothetical protein